MACETFCLEDDVNIDDVSNTLRSDLLTSETVRFVVVQENSDSQDVAAGKCSARVRCQ